MFATERVLNMNDNQDAAPTVTLQIGGNLLPAAPSPDRLILRDKTGQAWAISVRPDGHLQAAKWRDDEPMTPSVTYSDGNIASRDAAV